MEKDTRYIQTEFYRTTVVFDAQVLVKNIKIIKPDNITV